MAAPVAHASADRSSTARSRDAPLRYVWASARLLLSFVFLWAFADKTFGLGYSTKPANAWIRGGDPAYGFLANTSGWFAPFYRSLASSQLVEVLFMVGLLGIGLALLLGIGMRIAAASGIAMLLLMYFAKLPAATNPVYDADLLYSVVLVGLVLSDAGRTLGFGRAWSELAIVRRFPVLR